MSENAFITCLKTGVYFYNKGVSQKPTPFTLLLYQFHEYQEPGYYKAQEGSYCDKECIPRPGNLLRFFLFLFHHL